MHSLAWYAFGQASTCRAASAAIIMGLHGRVTADLQSVHCRDQCKALSQGDAFNYLEKGKKAWSNTNGECLKQDSHAFSSAPKTWGNCQAKQIARIEAAHRKTSRSRTQTVERLVAATVALRAQLYMRDTSPKQSPRFFMFTRMFTPCLRSSTCRQTCAAASTDTHLTPEGFVSPAGAQKAQ